MLPSPFDWQRQLLLCLPTDLPDPGAEEHDEVVIETIAQLARISGGGLLVLFTARQRMLAAYEALRQRLDALGLPVLCQDVSGERWWLLEHMRADERTVLLGVRSLWEGVDVPGQNLRCVLVEKLPFAVPDDPRVAARMEYLAKLGVDPYQNYYVPAAIRALRQGVGRLVRTSTDKGVVFLMDARIHHRAYGRRFISSLPPATKITAELAECLAAAAEWFSEGG
jgi:Rad3-related DNA helicase